MSEHVKKKTKNPKKSHEKKANFRFFHFCSYLDIGYLLYSLSYLSYYIETYP
jgi:hypothetical protein